MARLPDIPSTFLIHLITSYIMLGFAIFVQTMIIPSYRLIPAAALTSVQQSYLFRSLIVITPIMIAELLTAIRLARNVLNYDMHRYIRGDIAILVAIWIITLGFELPAHLSLLHNGLSTRTFRAISFSNIFKIGLWGLKGVYITKLTRLIFSSPNAHLEEFTS